VLRFLYETEAYADSMNVVATCLSLSSRYPKANLKQHASILNIQGLIEVDLGNPSQALLLFEEALGLRQALFAKDDWTVGVALSNVGLACMELGDVDRAMEYYQKALALRRQINCRMLDNSLANLAALLLRMGKPDEAEKMYRSVPGFENITDDDLLRDDKPRYSRYTSCHF
jgi:tetratricopeptide (TPR) repeat protein